MQYAYRRLSLDWMASLRGAVNWQPVSGLNLNHAEIKDGSVQADLSLSFVHMPVCYFRHAMSQIITVLLNSSSYESDRD